MRNTEALKQVLLTPRKVVITAHHKPDADALGSSLALERYLTKTGHDVAVIMPTDYPDFLHWMTGHDKVIIYNEGNEKKSDELIAAADLIFCLDFSQLHRINEMGESVRQSSAEKVVIDHHLEYENFADFNFRDTNAAATAELIYDLIVNIGDKSKVDIETAACLYAGIMTDTGSFRHSNTSAKVHRITAELIDIGLDTHIVHQLLFDNNSPDRLRFLGYILSEKLCVLPEYKTAYISVTAEELKRFNSKTGDTEGIVNYALSLKDIVAAVLIIDRVKMVKLSFRSIGDFPINELAKKYFEGGGHRNAAGGKSILTLEQTIEKFLAVLPEYKDRLHQQLKPNTLLC